MTAADHLSFLLAVMRVGRPLRVTPEPSTWNGRCNCGDCGAP